MKVKQADLSIPRPWSKITVRAANPLRFKGHPEAEQDPWLDRKTGLVQVHANSMGRVADYQNGGMWMPYQSYIDAEQTKAITAIEFCIHSPQGLACYRISGIDARTHGAKALKGRRGEKTKDTRWVIPFDQFTRLTVDGRGNVVEQPVRL